MRWAVQRHENAISNICIVRYAVKLCTDAAMPLNAPLGIMS